MGKLPTFSSNVFSWKNKTGMSSLPRIGLANFPSAGFYIRSEKTGKTQLFLPDTDKMIENEFFDGEASAYFAPSKGVEVRLWAG